MNKRYRIVFQTLDALDSEDVITEKVIMEDKIEAPQNCFDFSIGHSKQIDLLQAAQDQILNEKLKMLHQETTECPTCHIKLMKFGKQKSTFHDIFTDHEVKVQRLKCKTCGYELKSTVRTLLGTTVSGDLQKIQATLGAKVPYRESEQILDLFSGTERAINNHDRVKQTTESVGHALSEITKSETECLNAEGAKELIVNVDGGHVKTRENKRSIEALAAVVYKPESLKSNDTGTRNHIESKNCAASVLEDGQEIINGTIVAALKQGLTEKTHITALCDGAANCWRVVEALNPLCGQMTFILDWFHIGMKIHNISLSDELKDKLEKIKWHLWRGNVERALIRLDQVEQVVVNNKQREQLKQFKQYIINNKDKIVNYRDRQKQGLVFTSNLAESTVESLINRRCKGQQHMRWSREGLEPILQLRAAINSQNEWSNKWRTAIMNAA